ncbi:MAG: hypothetical protein H6632_14295 [Anaerolineales bacterium]|nr:hypothetical protein [Anaerolineales bacterium]
MISRREILRALIDIVISRREILRALIDIVISRREILRALIAIVISCREILRALIAIKLSYYYNPSCHLAGKRPLGFPKGPYLDLNLDI